MKRAIFTSAIIILLTAAIGIGLWANGFPPEQEGLSEGASALRGEITRPLFWAGLSALVSSVVIYVKRHQLRANAGKAQFVTMVGTQTPALAILLIQILVALKLYGLVDGDMGQVIFFYFLAGFFLLMGNYIVTAPYQSRIGYRTEATLSDERVWIRAHRFLGRSLMLATLISLPLPLFVEGQNAQWVLIGLVFAMKGLTWLHARRMATQISLRHTPG